MGRLLSLLGRSRAPAPPASEPAPAQPPGPGPAPAPQPVRRAPSPGQLRRERRALLRAREERIRDLGGLMLEMYKRDEFRSDLVSHRCGELVSLERRIQEVDTLLAAAAGAAPRTSARCSCGAPIIYGSHFCANCGRPVGDAAVVACPTCQSPLPAEARFCAACGSRVEQAGPVARSETPARDAAPPPDAGADPGQAAPPAPAEEETGAHDSWER